MEFIWLPIYSSLTYRKDGTMPTYQKVVEIVRLPLGPAIKCSHSKCDGRPARWRFPQAPLDSAGAKVVACNAHLAQVATVIENWHVIETPVPGTNCDG